ncbi:hypothetical protein CVS40_11076 [Lucilia cuprina]|nr:hypothetical protein CVS40_11076 [Lucilia cuprina]
MAHPVPEYSLVKRSRTKYGMNNTRGSVRGKSYLNWPKICHGRGRAGQAAQHPLLTSRHNVAMTRN